MGEICDFLAPDAAEPGAATVRTSSGSSYIAVNVSSARTGDGYRVVVGLVNHGTPHCLRVLRLSVDVSLCASLATGA